MNINRCAIYTRKSTEEGLDSDFNTLDAQRESAEALIKSQKHEGWECLPDRYDDGGFTGGNTDRPALQRLLRDIDAGRVDCVVVYKVDRLSRSLLDFAKMMENFDAKNVSLVAVTQNLNTTTSLGRLTLNILLSFAQFEREIISERTSDKMAAARRKGKYIGGRAVLGYDVVDRKLVVNELEAARVRRMFDLYLEQESLIDTARELNRLGWQTKSWRTKKGGVCEGTQFNKTRLHSILTNVVYSGRVKYKDETHDGEHEPIVDRKLFDRVQRLLAKNNNGGGPRNKYGSLLRGILHCGACNCAMSHSYSQRGNRRYRYYVCTNAQKNGWSACPAPSISAPKIEQFVIEEVRRYGENPAIVAATSANSRRLADDGVKRLVADQTALKRQRVADERELVSLATANLEDAERIARMAVVQDRINRAIAAIQAIANQLAKAKMVQPEDLEVAEKLANFDELWETMSPKERVKIVSLLVQRVEYDAANESVEITFHEIGEAMEVTQ